MSFQFYLDKVVLKKLSLVNYVKFVNIKKYNKQLYDKF